MEEEKGEIKKGLHNWKNLFKFDKKDIFWGFFFIALFFTIWAYKTDIKNCQQAIADACIYCEVNITQFYPDKNYSKVNWSGLIVTNITDNGT